MAASVDIVIPVYNESTTVPELITRLRAACPAARLIFVDNGSTDGTLDLIAAEPDVGLVRHAENLGYGRSILDGIAAGRGEVVVMIDADLEYHPEDVPALVQALETSPAVYGSRFLSAEGARTGVAGMGGVRAFGNRMVTSLFNTLFAQHLTDLYTGIRGVRRSAIPPGLACDGFELVLELAARLAQRGVRIADVPVGYTPRTRGESKMRHVPELLRFARRLVALRLSAAPAR